MRVLVTRPHPNLAELCRPKVARLQDEPNRPELRQEAAEVIRSLVNEVRLVPKNGRLAVELSGDLAGILALASGNKKPVTMDRDGLQVTVVAGARNRLNLLPFALALAVTPLPDRPEW